MSTDALYEAVTQSLDSIPSVLGERWPAFISELNELAQTIRSAEFLNDEELAIQLEGLLARHPELTGLRAENVIPKLRDPVRLLKPHGTVNGAVTRRPGTANHLVIAFVEKIERVASKPRGVDFPDRSFAEHVPAPIVPPKRPCT